MLNKLNRLINEATQQNLISVLRIWLDTERLGQSQTYHSSGALGEYSSESLYVWKHLNEIAETFYPNLKIIDLVEDIWRNFFYGKIINQLNLDKNQIKIAEFFTPYTFEILLSKSKEGDNKWKRKVQRQWRLYIKSEGFENDVYSSDIFQRLKRSDEFQGDAGLDA